MAPKRSTPVGPGSDKSFQWDCKNGNRITLPSLSTIDPDLGAAEDVADLLDRHDSENPIIAMGAQLKFLRASLPAEAGDQLRQLKTSEFEAFMQAWQEHSGVALGESSAS